MPFNVQLSFPNELLFGQFFKGNLSVCTEINRNQIIIQWTWMNHVCHTKTNWLLFYTKNGPFLKLCELFSFRTSFVQFCIVFFYIVHITIGSCQLEYLNFCFFHLKSLINISLTLGVIAIRNRLLLHSLHSWFMLNECSWCVRNSNEVNITLESVY